MNNFICVLHILVNFAEVLDSFIKLFEANTKEGQLGTEVNTETSTYRKNDDSGAVRLIRTTS